MATRFVSESIEPAGDAFGLTDVVVGEPAIPGRFVWRGAEYTVETVVRKWKETAADSYGSKEMYVRKHWFLVHTTCGAEMKIYFERQPRSKKQRLKRWWLYTITEAPDSVGSSGSSAG